MTDEFRAAIQTLIKYKGRETAYQEEHKKEIVAAFRTYWAHGPSEEEFRVLMGSIVLFPEMLYIMATAGR